MDQESQEKLGVNGNDIFAVVPEEEQRTIEIDVKGNNDIEVKTEKKRGSAKF